MVLESNPRCAPPLFHNLSLGESESVGRATASSFSSCLPHSSPDIVAKLLRSMPQRPIRVCPA
jgi:hypothetical protein